MPLHLAIPEVLSSKSWFIEKHLSELDHPLKGSVEKLLLISDYACRQIQCLLSLLAEDPCSALLKREDYFKAIRQLKKNLPLTNYSQALRHFRHRHFLRLLLLELAGRASTEEVMRSWSDCADAIILYTLDYLEGCMRLSYGSPKDEEGKEVHLVTLAMGKLGGGELNYSSDIDLIFAFDKAGLTDGREPINNQHYFSKMIQQFMQIVQNVTADGFVFRVDLRLRPNGDSGPLVASLAAMETYYQEQGRDWERYAMVKARVISEQADQVPPWFRHLIIPFVYRRYVDFSVIESLRSMKSMIEREVQLNPRLDDIKRGKGGIREFEFIIQSMQLIRGGRLPQLQQHQALKALSVLEKEQLIPHSQLLKQAYLYLRKLENALQSLNDQQTHSLPEDPVKQMQITLAMDHQSWEDLLIKLHRFQGAISHSFLRVLGRAEVYEDQKRLLMNQLSSLWQGHIEETMAINLLSGLGFENAPHCYQMLHAFRHGARCRRLSQSARMRLDRFMVMLIMELTPCADTDKVLLQVMHLLEHIVGRSAYLALLTENPQVLKELLFLFANSPFISSLLVNHPFLLEVLLDQEQHWKPYSRSQLEHLLEEKLSYHEDMELQEGVLRQFKLTHWLMAARAELYGLYNAVRIGQFLSDLAQVIVARVFLIATEDLSLRYPEMSQVKPHFAMLAYGTFGSREMNYTSDLDLVFLHTCPPSWEALVTRLTQKIVHMLTIRSQVGLLYSVDTRLRPSGSSGLLVSHVDAFIEYQKNQAWTWEHQALLKARVILGNSKIRSSFMQLKKSVLTAPRDTAALEQEVLAMRAKIEQNLPLDPLRHVPGGLLDLEFLIQFLVLAAHKEVLAKHTHTLSQIKQLALAHRLTKGQEKILRKAYIQYQTVLHQKIIHSKPAQNEALNAQVLAICSYIYSNSGL